MQNLQFKENRTQLYFNNARVLRVCPVFLVCGVLNVPVNATIFLTKVLYEYAIDFFYIFLVVFILRSKIPLCYKKTMIDLKTSSPKIRAKYD